MAEADDDVPRLVRASQPRACAAGVVPVRGARGGDGRGGARHNRPPRDPRGGYALNPPNFHRLASSVGTHVAAKPLIRRIAAES
eukprot:8957583-Pyramimonas_sp.AAC.1